MSELEAENVVHLPGRVADAATARALAAVIGPVEYEGKRYSDTANTVVLPAYTEIDPTARWTVHAFIARPLLGRNYRVSLMYKF